MKRGMRWLFDYLVNLYYIYFLLHVEELSFCFQFFSFNWNFHFFNQWSQIIKRNAILFTKNSGCGRVTINEWLIMSDLILKEVCYMTTSFPASHFFYDSVIISREHLKQCTWQGNCIYFTLVGVIHYNKWSVVDSRKIEEYVYLRKTIVVLLF